MKTEKLVDVTPNMPKMKMHEHLPSMGDVKVTMTGQQMQFMLATLFEVHVSLMKDIRNMELPQNARQEAYDYALSTELLYDALFKQLALYRTSNIELN